MAILLARDEYGDENKLCGFILILYVLRFLYQIGIFGLLFGRIFRNINKENENS